LREIYEIKKAMSRKKLNNNKKILWGETKGFFVTEIKMIYELQ